jgi:diaminobutyrate-2-oxoglutarate transaminase
MTVEPFDDLNFSDAPRLVTCLPGPKSRALLEKQERLEGGAVSYPKHLPIALESGRGATIRDVDGNVFIDFFGGAGVLTVGHSNPLVVQAVSEQVNRLTHTLDFPTVPRSELAELLISGAPGDDAARWKVLFGGPTGSDSVESAIKLAKANTGKLGLVAFTGGYHGMTSGALAVTSDKRFKEQYLPLIPQVDFSPYAYCYRCPLGLEHPGCSVRCADMLETMFTDPSSGVPTPAAVIVEPVQGEGGTIVPPAEFLREVRRITEEHGVLLIDDEIQAGMGRTGAMWSCENSGIDPDIMTVSKGLGGGLPLSAIMYHSRLDVWGPGSHIGTFRGHMTAMAAGIAAIRFTREHNLPDRALRLGRRITGRLAEEQEKRPIMGDVRGAGLMIGVEFVKDGKTKEPWEDLARDVRIQAYRRGLIVERGGHYNNVIRFLPPLVLTDELAERGTEIFLEAVAAAENRGPD